MNAAALGRDALAPRNADGIGRGLLLAIVAHLLLIAALTWSVRWKASEPEGVEAELWSALPQQAAPRAQAVEPLPKPEPKVELAYGDIPNFPRSTGRCSPTRQQYAQNRKY